MNDQRQHEEIGAFARSVLGLLLPLARREEFIGDLLEEAAQRHHRRAFVWAQLLRSLPSLVVARVRPATAAQSEAVPAPSGFGVGFLGAGKGQGRPRRSLALSLSFAAHVAILAVLVGRGAWAVDEISAPVVPVVLHQPFFASALPAPASQSQPVRRRVASHVAHVVPRPVLVAPRPQPAPSIAPPSTSPPSGEGEPDGRDGPEGPQSDDLHMVLAPTIGEKTCLSCPDPHLPPAYLRVGMVHDMLTKICVNAAGTVSSVSILRGVGEAADEGVRATIATWRFRPYAVNGRPVPFCYASRFVFTAR